MHSEHTLRCGNLTPWTEQQGPAAASISRELSREMLVLLSLSENPSRQKEKSVLNGNAFTTHGRATEGDRNFPLASAGAVVQAPELKLIMGK